MLKFHFRNSSKFKKTWTILSKLQINRVILSHFSKKMVLNSLRKFSLKTTSKFIQEFFSAFLQLIFHFLRKFFKKNSLNPSKPSISNNLTISKWLIWKRILFSINIDRELLIFILIFFSSLCRNVVKKCSLQHSTEWCHTPLPWGRGIIGGKMSN